MRAGKNSALAVQDRRSPNFDTLRVAEGRREKRNSGFSFPEHQTISRSAGSNDGVRRYTTGAEQQRLEEGWVDWADCDNTLLCFASIATRTSLESESEKRNIESKTETEQNKNKGECVCTLSSREDADNRCCHGAQCVAGDAPGIATERPCGVGEQCQDVFFELG